LELTFRRNLHFLYTLFTDFLLSKNGSSGMLRRVALVRTNVSEERITSIITMTTIGEPGATLAVTGDGRTLGSVRTVPGLIATVNFVPSWPMSSQLASVAD
jgi:hypothetical protein